MLARGGLFTRPRDLVPGFCLGLNGTSSREHLPYLPVTLRRAIKPPGSSTCSVLLAGTAQVKQL